MSELAPYAPNPPERWLARMRRLCEESRAGRRAMLLVAAAPAHTGVVGYGRASLVSIPADAPANAAPPDEGREEATEWR